MGLIIFTKNVRLRSKKILYFSISFEIIEKGFNIYILFFFNTDSFKRA